MRVALLANAYGISKYYKGGPGVRAFALHKALSLIGVENDVFYTGEPPYPHYLDERCHRVAGFEKKAIEKDESTVLSDYDVYQSLNSSELISLCNEVGIEPIADSNIIPNSPPNHCLKYLSEDELSMRSQQILQEQDLIRSLKVSRWLYQSKFQLNEYKRLGMKNLDICRQAPNGVDLELFKPREEQNNTIHWSGRNWWPKQPKLFSEVAKSLPNENFVVFSNDAMSFTSNVKTYVGLLHYQIAGKMSGKMSICLSCTENQSLYILESMACGLPLVAFNVSGNPEIVLDGKNGFLVEMDDIKGFTEKIKYLSEDENERKRLGKNGREMIKKKFSFKAMGKRYNEIYKEVLT